MVLNCKVSCEVNLSANIGKGEKEEKVEDMKPFACRYCPLTSKRRYNIRIHEERKHGKGEKEEKVEDMKRHVKEVHQRKRRDVKYNEKMGNETVSDENKYIESILKRVKTDFERKRELGKIAMEMICKYELNVHGMPQEVKNAIKFHLKMEGSC